MKKLFEVEFQPKYTSNRLLMFKIVEPGVNLWFGSEEEKKSCRAFAIALYKEDNRCNIYSMNDSRFEFGYFLKSCWWKDTQNNCLVGSFPYTNDIKQELEKYNLTIKESYVARFKRQLGQKNFAWDNSELYSIHDAKTQKIINNNHIAILVNKNKTNIIAMPCDHNVYHGSKQKTLNKWNEKVLLFTKTEIMKQIITNNDISKCFARVGIFSILH